MSAVRQNWHSTASVYFSKNSNPCLTSLKGTKQKQEDIGKMGKGLKPMQKFNQDEANSVNLWGYRLCVLLKIGNHVCQRESQWWSLALPEKQERPFRTMQ